MWFLNGDLPTSIPPCPPKPKKNKEMNNVHIFPNPGTAEISDAYANDMVYCRELRIALEMGDWEKLSEQAFFKKLIAYLKREGIMRNPSLAMYPEEAWTFPDENGEEERKMVRKKNREAAKNPNWVTKANVGIGKIPEPAEEKKEPVLKWEPAPSWEELAERFKRINELNNEAMRNTEEANKMTKWAGILTISSSVTVAIAIIIICFVAFLAK